MTLAESSQIDLRFPKPIARNSDPETSHESARETKRTTQKRHCARLLELIRSEPGCINHELAVLSGLELYETTKRVSDLIGTGRAHYGPARRGPTGRMCQTVFAGREVLL